MSVRSRAFHGGFASIPSCRRCWSSLSTSGDGADGGPSHMCLFLSGADGALFLTHSGTAFKSTLCTVGLFLTTSGTALTGDPSTFILVFFIVHTPTCHWHCPSQRRKGSATDNTLIEDENTDKNTMSHLTVTTTISLPKRNCSTTSITRIPRETRTETDTHSFTVHLDLPVRFLKI